MMIYNFHALASFFTPIKMKTNAILFLFWELGFLYELKIIMNRTKPYIHENAIALLE